MEFFTPFNTYIDFDEFTFKPEGEVIYRNLSDMDYMYQDQKAAQKLLTEDPVIYEFYTADIPEKKGHLRPVMSIIYPGKVGKEYNMTKGHYHEKEDTAEVYLTISGQGKLLMQSPENDIEILEMEKGSAGYIPPYWAHRCINVGDEPLVFFGVYPGEAGHDYGIIEEKGMKKIIVEENGEVVIEDNPNY